jgi:hypothetical protein
MIRIPIDDETDVTGEHCAIVFAPRRARDRFPENCVELCASEAEAHSRADPARKRYPARVVGPSRSSEGLRVYYLVRWLDE